MDKLDVELFNRIRAGDDAAFTELYAKYSRKVLQTVKRAGVPARDVEDVAQDVFADFYREVSSGKAQPTGVAAYICQRAQWYALRYHRKARRRPSTPSEEPDPASEVTPAAAHEKLEQEERRRAVLRILEKISPKLREAWVLKEVEELSYEEIATILNIGVSTAKMRVLRAKLAFKKMYFGEKDVTRGVLRRLIKRQPKG